MDASNKLLVQDQEVPHCPSYVGVYRCGSCENGARQKIYGSRMSPPLSEAPRQRGLFSRYVGRDIEALGREVMTKVKNTFRRSAFWISRDDHKASCC